jgi:Putative transposase
LSAYPRGDDAFSPRAASDSELLAWSEAVEVRGEKREQASSVFLWDNDQAILAKPSLEVADKGKFARVMAEGASFVPCSRGFFLPVRVLSRLFRRLFLEKLTAAQGQGRLILEGSLAKLATGNAFAALLQPLRRRNWFVYAKRPCRATRTAWRSRTQGSAPMTGARRHLPLQGLPGRWLGAAQGHDAGYARVHPRAINSWMQNPIWSALIMMGIFLLAGFLIALTAYGITREKPQSASLALRDPVQAVQSHIPTVEDVGREIETAVRRYGPARVTAAAVAGGLVAGLLAKRFAQPPVIYRTVPPPNGRRYACGRYA